ncbi:hypothetical protein K503DRAFT_855579 [Rhizopogon vinicolor AM-OR11-026]|uniref:Uncharacterized protein n=1 Tax=Rhizopogon vinicolor AM-OR11-026 TaxID=1314800 RepID=A0A1B7N5J5_9AGAM|nr:hypothetical protein K503DRAFT_855579 [Rhizopogon vinicolor AM-OR11-026]
MRSYYKTSRAASIPVPLVILSPFTNMSTNVVAADIDRIGVENILAQDPFLGGDIAGALRLEDRSTSERLYRLFITSLICRRGGYIPLHDLGAPAGLSTYLFINNNTSFNGSPLSSPVKSFLGAPVPAGLTFSTVHDLWLLSNGHPGALNCPSDDTIVPGVDAVIFQFNYYTPRAISYDVLRFMRKATHNTIILTNEDFQPCCLISDQIQISRMSLCTDCWRAPFLRVRCVSMELGRKPSAHNSPI